MAWKEQKASSYPDFVVWDDTPVIEGVVTDEFTFMVEGEERKGWIIAPDDSEPTAVGQTARLNLSKLIGKKVRIENHGFVRLNNGRRARNFKVLVWEEDAPF